MTIKAQTPQRITKRRAWDVADEQVKHFWLAVKTARRKQDWGAEDIALKKCDEWLEYRLRHKATDLVTEQ